MKKKYGEYLETEESEHSGFERPKFGKVIVFGVFLLVVFILLVSSVYKINAGHRGIVLTFGKPDMDASNEGIHFKIPVAQTVKKMEVRTQKIEAGADAASKDLQDVQTNIALNYHLSPGETPKLYQEIGLEYRERIINPAIQESVKAVTAQFTAEELITRRPEVRRGIQEFLIKRLARYYIVVDDFNIVNFQFSEEFDKAIEEKVTAEQKKLKAERDLDRIKVEKEQKITQAEAEAQSIIIQSKALRENPDILQLRWIEKWDGILPKVMGDSKPLIDVTGMI